MTTPPDYTELYNAIAGINDLTARSAYLVRDAADSAQAAQSFTELVPAQLTDLLAKVTAARSVVDTLDASLNVPDPIDPVAVFTAYQSVYDTFFGAHDSYSRYTGYQAAADDATQQGENDMAEFVTYLPQIKEAVTNLHELFQDWTPPED